jgi:hypothetical protein
MSFRPARDHEALPTPTTPAAHTAWSAANLTDVSIERRCAGRFQRFRWKRDPRIRTVLQYGLGSLVLPTIGPLAWKVANAELAAIRAGVVSRRGRGWIRFAKVCAIASTCALVAAAIAVIVAVT